MKKSAQDNIFSFLQANPSKFVSAQLERMMFKNKNGTTASPKSIRNRLQDLARDNTINVEEIDGLAYYSIGEEHRKKVFEYIPIMEGGRQVGVREVVKLV